MSLFTHEARQFKFDVLKEVASRGFQGNISETIVDEIAIKLIPGTKANFRCCVYKEREIIRERARLALGKNPNIIRKDSDNPKQIVHVLEAACDGCSIHKITVTGNCRKCMAKSCVASCKFDAIKMGIHQAYIDYDKCKSCGACAKACPFNAIVQSERPCIRSCALNAVSMDENNFAVIDESKCTNCGACQAGCPFGAIEDKSMMVDVINDLNAKKNVIAIVAPAIQGQMGGDMAQIKQAIRLLGFSDVLEAAIGADAVARFEKNELLKHIEEGVKLTTSCCPAFVNMAKMHFPEVFEKNVSHVVSPMEAIARLMHKLHPEAKIAFIGPCVAKKQESMEAFSVVDYVLTFEELAAMLIVKDIDASQVEPDENDIASAHGRGFAIGGGVSKAVARAIAEDNDNVTIQAKYADGAAECKMNLLLMKLGKFNEDILEGMACPGGCVCGPASLENSTLVKQRMAKENASIQDKTIHSTLESYDFSGVDFHR